MSAQFHYSTGLSSAATTTSPALELRQDTPAYDSDVEKQKAKDIKKVSRILRELTNDAVKLFPLLPTPSTWLLRCLLSTHYRAAPRSNWREGIILTLIHIKKASSGQHPDSALFFELDGKTPLFPNSENFSLASTHLYASTMLRYLNAKNLLDKHT